MKDHIRNMLRDVPPYTRFLSLREIDKMVSSLIRLPQVDQVEIGSTIEGETLNMLKIGEGDKTGLIIGVPHSDEPLGSLVTTFFSRWLATSPDAKHLGWRWLIIPVLERMGMRLNEGWFSSPGSFADIAKSYFRLPTEDQYEWTFPIKYNDYQWHKSRPETTAVKNILEREKPDLLCSLHHSGFTNAYYYLSRDMPSLYPELTKLSRSLRLPLSTKSPDVPFGKSLHPGFFQMYGLKDYLDYYTKRDPEVLAAIRRGACSDEWYISQIGGFSFNCEVPMYLSPPLQSKNVTKKSLKSVISERIKREKNSIAHSQRLMDKLKANKEMADPVLFDAAVKHIDNALVALKHKENTQALIEERNATVAEVFEQGALADMLDLFFLGQIWRVAESICVKGGEPKVCKLMEFTDIEIQSQAKILENTGNFYHIPLSIPAKMQLGSILIVCDALS